MLMFSWLCQHTKFSSMVQLKLMGMLLILKAFDHKPKYRKIKSLTNKLRDQQSHDMSSSKEHECAHQTWCKSIYSCQDISLKTRNMNLMVVLEKRSLGYILLGSRMFVLNLVPISLADVKIFQSQDTLSNKTSNNNFLYADNWKKKKKIVLFCFDQSSSGNICTWSFSNLDMKWKKNMRVKSAGIKMENGVAHWLLRNTLTHAQRCMYRYRKEPHTHTGGRTHSYTLTLGHRVRTPASPQCNQKTINSEGRATILFSIMTIKHTHTHSLRSMAVRCVHGYRASTPSLMATKEPWELVCDWLTDCFKDARII